MSRDLLCEPCAEQSFKSASEIREERGTRMRWIFGPLRISHPNEPSTISDFDGKVLKVIPHTEMVCDRCNKLLKVGDKVCCFSAWHVEQPEKHWEEEYLTVLGRTERKAW